MAARSSLDSGMATSTKLTAGVFGLWLGYAFQAALYQCESLVNNNEGTRVRWKITHTTARESSPLRSSALALSLTNGSVSIPGQIKHKSNQRLDAITY